MESGIRLLQLCPGGVNSLIQVTDLPKRELRAASNQILSLLSFSLFCGLMFIRVSYKQVRRQRLEGEEGEERIKATISLSLSLSNLGEMSRENSSGFSLSRWEVSVSVAVAVRFGLQLPQAAPRP